MKNPGIGEVVCAHVIDVHTRELKKLKGKITKIMVNGASLVLELVENGSVIVVDKDKCFRYKKPKSFVFHTEWLKVNDEVGLSNGAPLIIGAMIPKIFPYEFRELVFNKTTKVTIEVLE